MGHTTIKPPRHYSRVRGNLLDVVCQGARDITFRFLLRRLSCPFGTAEVEGLSEQVEISTERFLWMAQ
jgi:hypothetical protein